MPRAKEALSLKDGEESDHAGMTMMVMPIIAMMTSSISSAIGVKIISIIIGSVISTSRCWSLPTCPLSVTRHDRQDPGGRTLEGALRRPY
ncbi:hypothetical protein [Bradyrhizobium sp. USDA 3364]